MSAYNKFPIATHIRLAEELTPSERRDCKSVTDEYLGVRMASRRRQRKIATAIAMDEAGYKGEPYDY